MSPHPSRLTTFAAAALVGATTFLVGCRFPRDDDQWEPNNDIATATTLPLATSLSGRANEGDPDVFRIDVVTTSALSIVVEDRGLEELPSFTLTGPDGQDHYRDGTFNSHRRPQPEHAADGTSLHVAEGTYTLRVDNAAPGSWYLTIREMGAADNALLFSWDYQITATVE